MDNVTNPYLFNHLATNRIYLIQNIDTFDIPIDSYRKMLANNPEYNPEVTVVSFAGASSSSSAELSNSSEPFSLALSTSDSHGNLGSVAMHAGFKTDEQLVQEKKNRQKFIRIAKALHVASIWRTKLVNLGHEAQVWIDRFPPYHLYNIIEGRDIQLQEDHSKGDPIPLKILTYGEIYAAMLPIA
jgi:hypothetical protein